MATTAVACLVCLSACIVIVPHPMTTKVKSVSGGFAKFDSSFAKVGVTKRSEIEEKLSAFDSGYKNPKLIWTRWSQSKSGVSGGIALPYGGGAGGTSRNWSVQNIFFIFDDSGTLTSMDHFKDKELLRKLTATHQRFQRRPPDFSQPGMIEVLHHKDAAYHPAKLRISGDMLEMTESNGMHSVSVKRNEITSISAAGGDPETSCLPNCTDQTIHFSRPTGAGKQVTLRFALLDFDNFTWWMQLNSH